MWVDSFQNDFPIILNSFCGSQPKWWVLERHILYFQKVYTSTADGRFNIETKRFSVHIVRFFFSFYMALNRIRSVSEFFLWKHISIVCFVGNRACPVNQQRFMLIVYFCTMIKICHYWFWCKFTLSAAWSSYWFTYKSSWLAKT